MYVVPYSFVHLKFINFIPRGYIFLAYILYTFQGHLSLAPYLPIRAHFIYIPRPLHAFGVSVRAPRDIICWCLSWYNFSGSLSSNHTSFYIYSKIFIPYLFRCTPLAWLIVLFVIRWKRPRSGFRVYFVYLCDSYRKLNKESKKIGKQLPKSILDAIMTSRWRQFHNTATYWTRCHRDVIMTSRIDFRSCLPIFWDSSFNFLQESHK